MQKRGRDRLTSGVFARALEEKDKLATGLLDRAVRALGAGVASAVNLLDVEAVVVGGGIGTRLGEPYAARIADAMKPHLFRSDQPPALITHRLNPIGEQPTATVADIADPLTAAAEPRRERRSQRVWE